jgi:hypothetical protein
MVAAGRGIGARDTGLIKLSYDVSMSEIRFPLYAWVASRLVRDGEVGGLEDQEQKGWERLFAHAAKLGVTRWH